MSGEHKLDLVLTLADSDGDGEIGLDCECDGCRGMSDDTRVIEPEMLRALRALSRFRSDARIRIDESSTPYVDADGRIKVGF